MTWAEVPMLNNPFAENLGQTPFLRLGVIGDPVEHSLSPQMQEAALEALGIAGEYLAIQIPEAELSPALEHLSLLGFRGLNVTIPHKQNPTVLHYGDDAVRAIGATNAFMFGQPPSNLTHGIIHSSSVIAREKHSTNTDAVGFYAPINSLDVGRALLLGAGGAAAAATYALRAHGWKVSVWNRTQQSAVDLAAKFECEVRDEPSPKGCSLIVNATSVGLKSDEEPPLVWPDLEPGTTVYDLVYRQGSTDFLSHALLEGASTIDGREMLAAQGALSLRWWLGVNPPFETMRRAIGL